MSKSGFDFTISGAGLVGCLVATQLAKSGYRCCLIEKNKVLKKNTFKNYSPLSLNYRSYLLLQKFGLWDKLIKDAHPIKKLSLKSYHSLNRLKFDANDINLDKLGYVIDRRVLAQAIFNEVEKSKNIHLYDESTINKLQNSKNNDLLDIYTDSVSGGKLSSNYLIISDGAESNLKNILHIESTEINYSQTSFILNSEASFESNTAIQIFNKYGIFACIPYSENEISLVLTIKKEYSSLFIDKNKKVNHSIIKKIFKNYIYDLGLCKYISQYNLVTSRANEISRKNILLLGNSSQLLHPVGAQGFNLAISHIDILMKHVKSNNLDMKKLSTDLSKLRLDTFDNIDFATEIFANNKTPSMLMTFCVINTIKSSKSLKNVFLKKILGLEGYPYLTIGSGI